MDRLTKFSLKPRRCYHHGFSHFHTRCLFGSKLPMEFLPSIDNPAVTVTTLSPGLDAEAMTKVTDPLENNFAT